VYVLCGVLAAMAGLFNLTRIGIGDPRVGEGLELDAITAVVIGGTSLFGGRGLVAGTLGGVLLLGTINNMLDLLQVDSRYQQLIKGLIILLAVALYRERRKR
jgi:ribose transport system permease protein